MGLEMEHQISSLDIKPTARQPNRRGHPTTPRTQSSDEDSEPRDSQDECDWKMVTWVIRVGQKLATAHVRSGVSHCVDMSSLHKCMVVPRAELETAVFVS